MEPLKPGVRTSSFTLSAVVIATQVVGAFLAATQLGLTSFQKTIAIGAVAGGITLVTTVYTRNRTRLEGVWHAAEADLEKVLPAPLLSVIESMVEDAVMTAIGKAEHGTSPGVTFQPVPDPGTSATPSWPASA